MTDTNWVDRTIALAAFTIVAIIILDLAPPDAPPSTATSAATRVASQAPQHRPVSIKMRDVRVGDWVRAHNPRRDAAARAAEDLPDPVELRKITFELDGDGERVDVTLLRPTSWVAQRGLYPYGSYDLDLPEMNVAGRAVVTSISPASFAGERPDARHSLVTGVFRHTARDVVDLHVEGLDRPIGVTLNHPLWSEDRGDFVAVGLLRIGERLRAADGAAVRLTAIEPRAGPHTVYNLEVAGEHVYHISSLGLLAHNTGQCDLTGQIHHAIPRKVANALDAHPKLKGKYRYRDPNFVTQAKDLASHRGYQRWHRELDKEVVGWLKGREGVTPAQFEKYLKDLYARPDLKTRFPNGLP